MHRGAWGEHGGDQVGRRPPAPQGLATLASQAHTTAGATMTIAELEGTLLRWVSRDIEGK